MKRINQKLVYLLLFIIFVAAGFIYKLLFKGDVSGVVKAKDITNNETTIFEQPYSEVTLIDTYIQIYICGEVNNPGVYELKCGSILNDVVEMAGGMSDNAAVNYINLVYVLDTNISVYIPSVDEVNQYYDYSYIFLGDKNESHDNEGDNSVGQTDIGLININTASLEELMQLPGIGEATAKLIIEYRSTNKFNSIEDIMNVSGIGEGKYNKIKDLITT